LLTDPLQFIESDDSHVSIHVGVGAFDSAHSGGQDVLGGALPEDVIRIAR
jgi:hypothetical protein